MRRVGLRLRVRPHAIVHGRNNEHGALRRKEARGEQIVGLARCGVGQEVGGGRRDDDCRRSASKRDVIECATRIEKTGMHWTTRQRFERNGADELRGRAREHNVHLGARLHEQTRQPGAFVARDSARHAEQHAASSVGPKSAAGHDLLRHGFSVERRRGMTR